MSNSEIIKNRAVVADDWTVLRLSEGESADNVSIPAGKVIVPLAVWQARLAELQGRAPLGVWLNSDAQADAIKDDLKQFDVIGINFPIFTDGRGYSIAFNLRTRCGYSGELRAIGDVLRDQLFYMQRVGFDAFAVRADKNIHDALKGLTDFSEKYQSSWDEKTPLFRRVQRQPVSQD